MKLSIITINYNNSIGLEKTIQSVVNQTYKDFQYIVIDGGSTDNSLNIIKKYSYHIAYWVSEKDKGVYHAMNKGIDIAKGEYCLFINSGDCLHDDTVLEDVMQELDGTSVIIGSVKLSDGRIFTSPNEVTIEYFYNKKAADQSKRMNHQASFIKTELLRKYHYDEKYKIISDRKLLIQLLIYDNLSYKSINRIISLYDLTGISTIDVELDNKERIEVLSNDFPPHVFIFFQRINKGWENKLYNSFKESTSHKKIYSIIVIFLKACFFLKRNSWIKKFPTFID